MIRKESDPNIDINKLRAYIRAVEKIREIRWDRPIGTLTTAQGVTCPHMGPNYPDFLFDTRGVFSGIGQYAAIVREMGDRTEPEDMSLLQAEAMLTYIFRGERFCDGHVSGYIKSGELLHLLYRVEELVTGERSKIVFHAPDEWYGFLSNRYLSDLVDGGIRFSSVEQYLMYHKAKLFSDERNAELILATNDPAEIQRLGRQVTPFEPVIWNGHKQIILYRGLLEKFRQNGELCDKLVYSGSRTLVEGARNDPEYANGLNRDDPDRYDEKRWKGRNLLGYTLMEVRDALGDPSKMSESELMRRLVQRLHSYPDEFTICTYDLVRSVFPGKDDRVDLTETDCKLVKAARREGLQLDRSAYDGMDVGLPYYIPFVIRRTGRKKRD